ncbi:hypothetical protein [Neokomagataea thailandica]|uniref:hypothetical protein n=1 Tax=Neokomagataea TaxID=1223423 RepID=UPI000830ABD7|nr:MULTISPECIES: hypothetical protein [Neokomagataea]
MQIQVPPHTQSVVVTQEPSGVYLITLDMDQRHSVERLPPYRALKIVSWKTVRKLLPLLVLGGVACAGFYISSGSRHSPDVANPNSVPPSVAFDRALPASGPDLPPAPPNSASPFGLE